MLAFLHQVKVEFPSFGPVLCLQSSLFVDLGVGRLRQSKLHNIRERTLLELVAVQRQKLLELTAHFTVLDAKKTQAYLSPLQTPGHIKGKLPKACRLLS